MQRLREKSHEALLRKSTSLAFSQTNFDSSAYSAYRPTYGGALYKQLLDYHRGHRERAVDLGCGTGQISSVLSKHFGTVYGFDTSAKMLESATPAENILYRTGSAEQLELENDSVDLVTVGQAAHWFNHSAWFAEMHRILKSSGTLSFWSYNEAVFTDSPEATRILNKYFHGQDLLGPHWPQPGRSILENAMDGIDPPTDLFTQIERHYTAQRGNADPSPVSREMTLANAELYTRTSSAFHNWQAAHPAIKSKRANGEGDVIDAMFTDIKAATNWSDETYVKLHWPTIAVLARKP